MVAGVRLVERESREELLECVAARSVELGRCRDAEAGGEEGGAGGKQVAS